MKKSRFTESQIVAILKEGEAGLAVAQLTRKHGISAATYYHWKSKYGGAGVSELKRLRELEAENAKLKRMYADLALENTAICQGSLNFPQVWSLNFPHLRVDVTRLIHILQRAPVRP
jgi:putative transposase